MNREVSYRHASTAAPDQAITEASKEQPEALQPDIQQANIDTTMAKIADLFDKLIAEKADKPLQGERPTGNKRTTAQCETAEGEESA